MHPCLMYHPLTPSILPSTLFSILKQKQLIRHFQGLSCSISQQHLNLATLLPSLKTLSSLGFWAPVYPASFCFSCYHAGWLAFLFWAPLYCSSSKPSSHPFSLYAPLTLTWSTNPCPPPLYSGLPTFSLQLDPPFCAEAYVQLAEWPCLLIPQTPTPCAEDKSPITPPNWDLFRWHQGFLLNLFSHPCIQWVTEPWWHCPLFTSLNCHWHLSPSCHLLSAAFWNPLLWFFFILFSTYSLVMNSRFLLKISKIYQVVKWPNLHHMALTTLT